jgi:hypothetical protein
LCDHRVGVRQHGTRGDVFIPRIRDRENLHGRKNGVGVGRVEQDGIGHPRRGAKDAAFVIDTLGQGRTDKQNQGSEGSWQVESHACGYNLRHETSKYKARVAASAA